MPIIARLHGGLGNQLFQYAAARRLSLFHGTELKLDPSHFVHRSYSLHPFSIQENFATLEEVTCTKGERRQGLHGYVLKLKERSKPYYHRSIFSERYLRPYDPNILKTQKDVYLDGYWQSEKYFQDISDVIRREFTVRFPFDSLNKKIAEEIKQCESVSVHVRRGDYVTSAAKNRFHGTCSLDYYATCVRLVAEEVKDPHFFVFSDDPQWVTENIHFNYPTRYVTHNDATKHYEDLRLMMLCKHNVIANSSFSWWGAWLNSNPDKIVLAPSKWFNEAALDTRDLLPDSWVKI